MILKSLLVGYIYEIRNLTIWRLMMKNRILMHHKCFDVIAQEIVLRTQCIQTDRVCYSIVKNIDDDIKEHIREFIKENKGYKEKMTIEIEPQKDIERSFLTILEKNEK